MELPKTGTQYTRTGDTLGNLTSKKVMVGKKNKKAKFDEFTTYYFNNVPESIVLRKGKTFQAFQKVKGKWKSMLA